MPETIGRVREMVLEDCQDERCDECPEYRDSILQPGIVLYICDCSCHA